MTSRAEETASHCLRAVLAPLSPGAPIEDSEDFSTFETALSRVIPSALAEVYDYWRYEGLDGFRFAVARKVGPEEAEFVGLCLLVSDQTWIPLHVHLRITHGSDHIDWLECKVGEFGNGEERMVGTSYGSTRETKALYSVVNRLESISWVYRITRGSP